MNNCSVTLAFEHRGLTSEVQGQTLPPKFASSWASPSLAHEIVREFNFAYGDRILDCKAAFKQIRKTFGGNFAFAFGFEADEAFRLKVASKVAARLRNFVLNQHEPDVTVCDRLTNGLVSVESSIQDITDCYGRTILVSTGESSFYFGIPVFLRLDVEAPKDDSALLQLDRILFTDENGDSIAGMADITDWVEDLENADRAFKEVLGHEYDVLHTNARIYAAWCASAGKDFSVDLTDVQEERVCNEIICKFEHRHIAWHDGWCISFVLDGAKWLMSEYAHDMGDLVASWPATRVALADSIRAFRNLSLEEALKGINFAHIFDENHLKRYSDGSADIVRTDSHSARKIFEEALDSALERLCDDDDAWLPFFFNRGSEKSVTWAGDSFDANLSLLAPLYLSDEDRERHVPSVYLVACLKTLKDGKKQCVFPSVLSVSQAASNNRYFRRALRNWNRAA